MSDIIKFPGAEPGPRTDIGRALTADLLNPTTRTFAGIVFRENGESNIYLPDNLSLADLLMAKCMIDAVARRMIDLDADTG